MKFEITFKQGLCTITTIHGVRTLDKKDLSVDELQKIIDTEVFLEKLTGIRVHINEAH